MLSFSNRLLSASVSSLILMCFLSVAQAQSAAQSTVTVRQMSEQFAVTGQIRPDQLAELKERGYTSIVALRPDNEGGDQPSAAQIEAAAKALGLSFAYIPVSSATISGSQLSTLQEVLSADSGKVLAYCRSGNRAARAWGLAEASRPGGPSSEQILSVVKAAGYSAADLSAEIDTRISKRASEPETRH